MLVALSWTVIVISSCFQIALSQNSPVVKGSNQSSILSAKVRKSLIGHIQDFSSNNNVLTQRQKLAISQELEFRKQGFQPFSSETDENINRSKNLNKEISRSITRKSQNSFMITNSQDNVRSFPASNQKSPPHALLNSLSLRDKLIFHDKFNKLPKSQQEFVFKTLQTSDLPAQEFAVSQILKMNVPSIIMSLQKEMLKASQGPGPSQEQFVSPEPIFDPIYQFHNKNTPPSADQIRPVAIFSRPEIIPHARPAPVLIEPFSGPFAELDKEVEKEIQLFRAEADKANEEALKKQIEALKNIISDQKKSV